MSSGRASGALSRTRTPLEPGPEPEPERETEPNHRYRVGQVARVGGTKKRGPRNARRGGGCTRPDSGRCRGGINTDSSVFSELAV